MTSKSTWKKCEMRVARYFGSERNPLSGGNGKISRSDSRHPELFIETKLRKAFSPIRVWDRAKEFAKKEGKIPVVALCEKNRPGFWVLCHSDDFEDIRTCREVARLDGG